MPSSTRLDLSLRLDTGPLHHELLAGVEIGQDSYTNQAYSRTGQCNGGDDGHRLRRAASRCSVPVRGKPGDMPERQRQPVHEPANIVAPT